MTKLSTTKLILTCALSTTLLFAYSADVNGQSFRPKSGGSSGSTQTSKSTTTPTTFNKIPFGGPRQSSPSNTSFNTPVTSDKIPASPMSTRQTSKPRQNPAVLPRQGIQKRSVQGIGYSQPNPQTNSDVVEPMPKHIDLTSCAVNFIDDIMLPAREVGVIKSLNVKKGDFMKAGTVVGSIDDELYQQMLKQAELRYSIAEETALDTIGIKAARKKLQVASIEANKASKLAASGSKSDSERMMAVYTRDLAELELTKAERDRKKAYSEALLANAQMEEVKARLRRHSLGVAFDSYVIEILKNPGEHVNVGDEVMRVARLDKLKVSANVNFDYLNAHEMVNRPVTVTVDLARNGKQIFEGKVSNVGLERHGSGFNVTAEIDNRPVGGHWVLQANTIVDMRIHLKDDN